MFVNNRCSHHLSRTILATCNSCQNFNFILWRLILEEWDAQFVVGQLNVNWKKTPSRKEKNQPKYIKQKEEEKEFIIDELLRKVDPKCILHNKKAYDRIG